MRKVSQGVLMTGVSLATVLATVPMSAYAFDSPSTVESSTETKTTSENIKLIYETDYGVPAPKQESKPFGRGSLSQLADVEWQYVLLGGIALTSGVGMLAILVARNKDD